MQMLKKLITKKNLNPEVIQLELLKDINFVKDYVIEYLMP